MLSGKLGEINKIYYQTRIAYQIDDIETDMEEETAAQEYFTAKIIGLHININMDRNIPTKDPKSHEIVDNIVAKRCKWTYSSSAYNVDEVFQMLKQGRIKIATKDCQIDKPRKDLIYVPNNRPVSLLDVMEKWHGKIINSRLIKHARNRNK